MAGINVNANASKKALLVSTTVSTEILWNCLTLNSIVALKNFCSQITTEKFDCGNAGCIPIAWVNDGENDCGNNNDEGKKTYTYIKW